MSTADLAQWLGAHFTFSHGSTSGLDGRMSVGVSTQVRVQLLRVPRAGARLLGPGPQMG